jgi:cob(I)alamin adenosyltransferase
MGTEDDAAAAPTQEQLMAQLSDEVAKAHTTFAFLQKEVDRLEKMINEYRAALQAMGCVLLTLATTAAANDNLKSE